MTKRLLILCVAGMLSLTAGTAMADSIKNRLGVTGRMGFIVPSDNGEVLTGTTGTNTEFIGGGGFIYGITDNIAGEFDITHAGEGNFDVTNLAFGLQYRFPIQTIPQLVPYAGGGFDVLLIGAEVGNVDDVVGGHVSGGVDYFILKDLAVNAELKVVLAPDADVKGPGGAVTFTKFDPTSFSTTFGVRYFFF